QDVGAFAAKDPLDLDSDVRVLVVENLLTLRDDGDTASEAAVRLRELEADVSTAEHDEVLGQAIELEQLDVGERPGIREPGDGWHHGMRPDVEEHPVT